MIMTRNKTSLAEIGIHVLFWIVYIISEYYANLMHMYPGKEIQFLQVSLLTLPALLIPTYFITLFVVPRYLHTAKWPLFIAWVLAIGFIVFIVRVQWAELVNYIQYREHFDIPVSKILKNIIRDYSVIALAVCISIIGDYAKKQKLNEQLMKANVDAEIRLLKGQLHPHFLFNSLNNIYSLALTKSEQTADSILKLTELLDYLVYQANKQKVELSKEVDLLHHYIDLEKLRHGDKLDVTTDMLITNEHIRVTPLILLPFAENSFKHGGAGQQGIFKIALFLRADKQRLVFEMSNTKNRNQAAAIQGGIGLENIRQRLGFLYPGRHTLEIMDSPDSFIVKLEIKLKYEDV
jgi:two-component system LytT family sensor kinase